MNIQTLGIDIAKNVFQLHGVNRSGYVESEACQRIARIKGIGPKTATAIAPRYHRVTPDRCLQRTKADLFQNRLAKGEPSKLSADKSTPEWWLYVSGTFLSIAKDAIEKQDAPLAAWAVVCAERYRSLYPFKEHFEEVVWMGHSAKRLLWTRPNHPAGTRKDQTRHNPKSPLATPKERRIKSAVG